MCTDVAGHLQPHCHWLLELAIVIVSAIAEGQVHVVSHYIATSIYGNCNHGNWFQNTLLGRSVDGVVMDTDDVASDEVCPYAPPPVLLATPPPEPLPFITGASAAVVVVVVCVEQVSSQTNAARDQ